VAYTVAVPSRFGSPRGSIGRILKEAGEISDARLRATIRYLDDFTSIEDHPDKQIGGGGRLTRAEFTAMLQQQPDFRQQLANRWLFATAPERDKLLAQLRDAFPGQGRAALGVPGLDDSGIPDDQMGTGLGGPPQGATPVGPQPGMGMAPTPPEGSSPSLPPGPGEMVQPGGAAPVGPPGPAPLPGEAPTAGGMPPASPTANTPIPQIGPRGVPLPGPGNPANTELPAPGLGPPQLPPPGMGIPAGPPMPGPLPSNAARLVGLPPGV